jgi:hypothetical protein
VRDAAGDDLELVLRAVDVRVTASRDRVVVGGGAVPLGRRTCAVSPRLAHCSYGGTLVGGRWAKCARRR